MPNIKFRSIKNQLTTTTVFTCGIVLLLAFLSLSAFEITSARRATIGELSALAKIVGQNVAGALAFNDADYAENMLSALSAKHPIEYADIHARDGRVFATYDPRGLRTEVLEHRGATIASLDHETIGSLLLESFKLFAVSGHVDISGPISLNDEIIGEIHLRSNLSDAKSRVVFYFLITGGAMILLCLGSFLVSSRLHRAISEQIINLAAAMKTVAVHKNYGVRADKHRDDELGILVDGFNSMLDQLKIWSRERENAKLQAEAADRTKSEFLAAMSHELRTPLNAIIGFSEVMKNETFGPVGSARYREYSDDIHESGQHLLGLINNILDLSKIESGKDELHEEKINIPEILRSSLKLVGHHAERGDVRLKLDLPDRLPALRADQRKLKQILVNLLSNAIKFTDANGEVTLKAWCRRDCGYVFQIVDSGIGMVPEDIPKALSRFGQLDGDLSRHYDGTGLGLPLTKALVESHGGTLDLQSQVGTGTTVTVCFPAERIVESVDDTAAS